MHVTCYVFLLDLQYERWAPLFPVYLTQSIVDTPNEFGATFLPVQNFIRNMDIHYQKRPVIGGCWSRVLVWGDFPMSCRVQTLQDSRTKGTFRSRPFDSRTKGTFHKVEMEHLPLDPGIWIAPLHPKRAWEESTLCKQIVGPSGLKGSKVWGFTLGSIHCSPHFWGSQ